MQGEAVRSGRWLGAALALAGFGLAATLCGAQEQRPDPQPQEREREGTGSAASHAPGNVGKSQSNPTTTSSEPGSSSAGNASAGNTSGGGSRGRDLDRDEAARVEIAPRFDAIREALRENRVDWAERQAQQTLRTAERAAGERSRAASDAMEVLLEVRSQRGDRGEDTREILRRVIEIRDPEGRDPAEERPMPVGEGVVQTPDSAVRRAQSAEQTKDHGVWKWTAWRLGHLCDLAGPLEPPLAGGIPLQLEQSFGSIHEADYLQCLEAVGRDVMWQDPQRALGLLTRAVELRRLSPDENSLRLAHALSSLGHARMMLLDYGAARRQYEEALGIREQALGDHPLVASALNDLARAQYALGNYRQAQPLFERAVAIWQADPGHSQSDLITGLDNLAQLCWTLADYGRARALFEQALALSERDVGPKHRLLVVSLERYGMLLYTTGDFPAARAQFARALRIIEKSIGVRSVEAGWIHSKLGATFLRTGDLRQGKLHLDRALKILEEAWGPSDPRITGTLHHIAILRIMTGEAGARALLERALRIREETLGPEHPDVAPLLRSLAVAAWSEGRHEEALGLAMRALAIQGEALGPQHPEVARSLVTIADHLPTSKARPLYLQAAQIRESALGTQHPDVADALARLAGALLSEGQGSAALAAALRAETISADHLSWAARGLSEEEALRFASTRPVALDIALSIAAAGTDDTSRQTILDRLIRSRALVLDEVAARKRLELGSGDPRVVAATQALSAESRRLAKLIVAGPQGSGPPYTQLVEQAREARDEAERQLARVLAPFREEATRRRAGLAEVLSALPPRSALVAFVRYQQYSVGPGHGAARVQTVPSYLAFVATSGGTTPSAVPLGAAASIEALLLRWRQEVARPRLVQATAPGSLAGARDGAEAAYRSVGSALRNQVWDPIEPLLEGAERVFLVPDAGLHLLNWGALPVADGSYLVESGPLLHYLSAERDLVTHAGPRARGRGLLVLGDPDFDESRPKLLHAIAPSTVAPPPPRAGTLVADSRPHASAFRGNPAGCAAFRSVRFERLPATEREAAEIAALWASRTPTGNDPRDVIHLTASQASEASFKTNASGRRILHVATHGFFLASPCLAGEGAGQRGVGGLVSAEPPSLPVEDALLLSGLAFAGANHRTRRKANDEDGVLTAEEIASLDLSGVEWAVLSACNTGVGALRAGEGVLGLRRAFEVAGAGTVIMSLWPVEDEAASRWMQALYQARLDRGLATAEATRAASVEMIREHRVTGRSTHPSQWAAFVAAGDWR